MIPLIKTMTILFPNESFPDWINAPNTKFVPIPVDNAIGGFLVCPILQDGEYQRVRLLIF